MSLFARWLRPGGVATRESGRWLMVDVEASGLDAAQDRLLAIAALALKVDWARKTLAVTPGDSFEVVLRQEVASARDNILLHGIGVQQQRAGVAMADGMAAFAGFTADSPLLAFHAAFDRTMVRRHAAKGREGAIRNPWLDVEHLCGVTYPQVRARSLDEWLAFFGIRCADRHRAAADALAQAELLLRIWPRIAPECASWRDLERLASRHRWVPRG